MDEPISGLPFIDSLALIQYNIGLYRRGKDSDIENKLLCDALHQCLVEDGTQLVTQLLCFV